MNPRPSSTKMRRECFDVHRKADEAGRIYLICWICKGRIDPARERWEAEHSVRRVVGGSDDPTTNVFPAHASCHAKKSSRDNIDTAKGKRVADQHFGIKRSSGWNRRFRKKLNGEVVER